MLWSVICRAARGLSAHSLLEVSMEDEDLGQKPPGVAHDPRSYSHHDPG